MASTRLKALAGVVVALGLLQILFEDVVVFLGATGALPTGIAGSPFVMVAVPLAISVTLVLVLLGAALWHSDTLR